MGSPTRRSLLILATLDTKGREALFVKAEAERLGVRGLLMDVGLRPSPYKADIGSSNVCEAAGYSLEDALQRGRAFAIEAMQKGAGETAQALYREDRIHGILGIGGGTGTAIATHVMRMLPFGFPKVMVSTVASRDVRPYVGVKDIVMFHSVADLLGFNSFTRSILSRATCAVCAMMGGHASFVPERPLIALTAYGINSSCAFHVEPLVTERGYELICFHANGCGGMAMEEMVREGLIRGVLDFTLHEFVDDMFGGYCRGIGDERLRVALETSTPIVIVPGGLDNAVFSPSHPMPECLKGRKVHRHDERFCVRMHVPELQALASKIGARIKGCKGPIYVLIPKKGFSGIDREGTEFYKGEAIRASLRS